MTQDQVRQEPIIGQEESIGHQATPEKDDGPMNQSQVQPQPSIAGPERIVQQEINPSPLVSSDTATSLSPELASKSSQTSASSASNDSNLDLIMNIPVTVQVILGTTKMPVSKIMQLGRHAIIPLDRNVGDPIDVVVNGRTVARGEVVLMEDDDTRFGISITELVTN